MSPEYKFFESEMPHLNYEEFTEQRGKCTLGSRCAALEGDLIAAQIRTEELEGTLELAEDEIQRLHQLISHHLVNEWKRRESEQALWEAIGGKKAPGDGDD